MSEFGQTGALLILLGFFFVYRVLTIYLQQIGRPEISSPINYLWLGLCIYTWVGLELFRRSLHKEMKSVMPRDDF